MIIFNSVLVGFTDSLCFAHQFSIILKALLMRSYKMPSKFIMTPNCGIFFVIRENSPFVVKRKSDFRLATLNNKLDYRTKCRVHFYPPIYIKVLSHGLVWPASTRKLRLFKKIHKSRLLHILFLNYGKSMPKSSWKCFVTAQTSNESEIMTVVMY